MSARILIIEDNQANMDLLTYLLQAFGHHTLAAVDGEQGVALARREHPDLVVCDLHLPRLDGYGVVAQLRADSATRTIPVLAASALPVTDGCAALRRAGFSGCLPKSLEPDELLPALESFLPPHLRSYARPGVPPPRAAAAPALAPAPQARILLLDAAPENAGLVASILTHSGYGVASAANTAQAAALAGQPFDLLLCDMGLAEAARLAFLAEALAVLPPWPVVVIRPDEDDDVSALAPGRQRAVLAHPLEPQQLVAAIAAALAG